MSKPDYDLIVIGGGAAGFFGAIRAAELRKEYRVLILEKTSKLLSKVKVSGGGRCNVTHHCVSPAQLAQHYPRGQRALKNVFHQFQASDTIKWFEQRGVKLHVEADGRMFPITNDSQTIIDCFLQEAERLKVKIKMGSEVTALEKKSDHFLVQADQAYTCNKVLVATGGYNKPENYQWLVNLRHELVHPIPSLFTFNDPAKEFIDLMGLAVSHAEVKIAGTKFSQKGAVLITHWGLSGPAVIKLSAWAAVYLHQQHYNFITLVNWTGEPETIVREALMNLKSESSKKHVTTSAMFKLPKRLWEFLCLKASIDEKLIWAELPNKSINKLIEFLTACPFTIKGKTTFKEEFVTCGGIALSEIDVQKMESKKIPGLYFAGEVLDEDGETGGFNFQAAWSTAWVAATALVSEG